jgi:hypothetical protein
MNASGSPKRRWGPFSGRQLTVIIVSLMVGLVLVPSTVWAVDTFSNVAIEDPVSGVKASVDAQHNLAVAGTVHALAASPTTPFSFSEDINNAAYTRVAGPTASAINLTALALSPKDNQNIQGDFFLFAIPQPAAQTTCTPGGAGYTLFHVPSIAPSPVFVESFPTPLVVPRAAAGTKTCLFAYVDTNLAWTVNGSGFLGR